MDEKPKPKNAPKPDIGLLRRLECEAGIGVHRAVKRLCDIALNRSGKTPEALQQATCLKLIEMYYGKVGENKTITNNINIGFDDKMLEIANKIKELGINSKIKQINSNTNTNIIEIENKND